MSSLSRGDAEEFLAREALLIDDGRYEEWAALFTEDGIYWVPGDDPAADPETSVSIIYDDGARRNARITRFQHRSNWRDDPPGRLAHLVTNVLVDGSAEGDAAGEVTVRSNQLVSHARRGETLQLVARCTHRLRPVDGEWRIVLKKAELLGADQYLPPDSIVLL